MNRRLFIRLLLALLALLAQPVSAEPVTVRVAVPAPMDGPRAPMGRAVHAAAAMVAADINAGDSPVKVEMVPVEDTCTSVAAARSVETLAAAKFDAVIGYACRASAQAAVSVFARSGQLLIATAPVIPPFGLTQIGPTVFRLPVAEKSLGQYIGSRLAAAPAEARIAIIRDKTQQAIGLAQAVDAGVRAGGRMVQAAEVFTGGDKAFGPMVARLKTRGATHVALLAFPVEGGLIAAELVAALPDIEIIGPDYLATADTPLIAGAAASKLRVVLPGEDPLGAGASGQNLRARLKAQDIASGSEALVIAASIEAYVDAVRRAGSTEPATVAAALRSPPDRTPRYSAGVFDIRGHRVAPYWATFRWNDGRLVQGKE
jgi:branched-chain amino acid transport system substrate-binding protein